jgi:hypothetical protein
MKEHDHEPVPGLPAPLPPGETMLWQGAPGWKTLARHAMRVRLVGAYFALLTIWGASGRLSAGRPPSEVFLAALQLGALGAIAIALLVLFAWLVARTTLYTITTRRVVMRFGIALPITIQISFNTIGSAGVHVWSCGAGDIALSLMPGQRIAYMVLWPHARAWTLAKAQPTLRGVPDAAVVAHILGRSLEMSASQPAMALMIPATEPAGVDNHAPAAA